MISAEIVDSFAVSGAYINSSMKNITKSPDMFAFCAYCSNYGNLSMSHAIPKAAFKTMLRAGSGKAIGIPKGDGDAHLTSDTGEAPLLCEKCENDFNRNFDGPLTNALKVLENEIKKQGLRTTIDFPANQMAHAVGSVAWRIARSDALMFSEVVLSPKHMEELDALIRLPSDEVLKHCTVRIGRLIDKTPRKSGGFGDELMGQFMKGPGVFSTQKKRNGKFGHFMMDWTMFGFIVHIIVPRLPYPKSKNFGGLKRGATQIRAVPVDMLEYPPMRDALVAGFAAQEEDRLSPALKKRADKRSKN